MEYQTCNIFLSQNSVTEFTDFESIVWLLCGDQQFGEFHELLHVAHGSVHENE
jgi:hypothetical protein